MADVELRGVTKRFGQTTAVSDLSLDIGDGEFVVLLGPTGAGKTTTLRLIAGLERPEAGRISIGGRDVTLSPPAERDVAFVFQQYSLYPHMTVYENMAFPLRSPARRLPEDAVEARVRDTAAMLHISHKLKSKATQLSGGEMQRVAIGRALVRQPSIYLMDEPLSSLDAKLRSELRLELKRIQGELGATTLYVTHDQIEAMTMGDRIGVIRDGRLVQVGTPREIYETPRDIYVAERLGMPRINLLPRDLFADGAMPGAAETIGARTEHIDIAGAGGTEARSEENGGGPVARVTWIEHLGDQNHMHLDLNGREIVTLADPHARVSVGDRVTLSLVDPLYFDSDGLRIDPSKAGGAGHDLR
jgi:multiple sugar transport system ATP-binding protein